MARGISRRDRYERRMLDGMRAAAHHVAANEGITGAAEVAAFVADVEQYTRRRLHRERLEARLDVVYDEIAEAKVELEDAKAELAALGPSVGGTLTGRTTST